MSHRRFTAAVVVALFGSLVFAAPSTGSPPAHAAAKVWIVTLEDGTSPRQVAAEHANEHSADVLFVYEHALNGYAARMSAQAVEQISRDTRVKAMTPDRIVSIEAKGGKPGNGTTPSPSQVPPTGVARIRGPGSTPVTGGIAVLDTGVEASHPDLNVVGSKSCIWNESPATDGNGHGTHVAGTIAAKDNAIGVVGVAPGAPIYSVKVLSKTGSGSWSSVICGVDWVRQQGNAIKVANMSLGGSGTEPEAAGCSTADALHNAICNAVGSGVTFVVAAGNSGIDAKSQVPAAYDEVITVSALADFDGTAGGNATSTCRTDDDDTFADFSNFGEDVDLIAPGVCIRSTWKDGGYNTISGTSMASPHVAGAAALQLAAHGGTPNQVKLALQGALSTDWSNVDDSDGVKEELVDVDTL